MTRLYLLLLTICCLAGSIPALGADQPLRVTIRQNGTAIKAAASGDYLLAQGPFTIRVESAGRPASIIATTDARALSQLSTFKRPLIAFPGYGAASSPGLLLITDLGASGLELYPGWNDSFGSNHGVSLGPEAKTQYQTVRKGLKDEPTILTTGRQYVNFETTADGAEEMAVQELAGSVPVGTPIHLLVFAEKWPTAQPAEIYLLDWTTLTVRFQPLAVAVSGGKP